MDPIINLDTVLNTGENDDRKPIETPEKPDPNKPDDKGNSSSASTPNNPPATPPVDESEDQIKIRSLFSSFADDSSLDDEKKGIRKKLLDKYQGESFDQNGNVIDKDGKTVKEFKDIYTDLNTELTLDDKGNQVDKDGNIIKTKFELAAETTEVNRLHKLSGYEIHDENGEIKIYEDSEAGLNEFTDDLAEVKFNEKIERYFNQHPLLDRVAKHLLAGKDLSTFNQPIDYDKIDKKALSTDEKLAYIRKSYEITGMAKERIDSIISLIKDGNKVDADFDAAIASLKQHQADLIKKENDDYQKALADHTRKLEEHWNNVKSIIDTDKTKFVTIPKAEKEAFYNYISNAVDNNGNSQAMLDAQAQSIEEKIGLDYLRFKGFNFDTLIKQKVQEKSVEGLRDLIKKSAGVAPATQSSSSSNSGNNNVDISISTLLGN